MSSTRIGARRRRAQSHGAGANFGQTSGAATGNWRSRVVRQLNKVGVFAIESATLNVAPVLERPRLLTALRRERHRKRDYYK